MRSHGTSNTEPMLPHTYYDRRYTPLPPSSPQPPTASVPCVSLDNEPRPPALSRRCTPLAPPPVSSPTQPPSLHPSLHSPPRHHHARLQEARPRSPWAAAACPPPPPRRPPLSLCLPAGRLLRRAARSRRSCRSGRCRRARCSGSRSATQPATTPTHDPRSAPVDGRSQC